MSAGSMRAVVTGGAGFLGHHLIHALLQRGVAVCAIDNFSNGRREHLAPFMQNPGFALREGSITDANLAAGAVEEFRPDAVYHLAAIHFIPYCVAHPLETIETNVVGTQRILDALPGSSVKRFVFASTADVYVPSEAPHTEASAVGSTNVYGSSKEFSERLMAIAQTRSPGIRFLRARLFNLYGPGETNPHLIPDIMEWLRKGNTVRLGNIDPKRDYVYVGDVAEAFACLGTYAGNHNCFNIGTGVGRSVRDVIDALKEVLGHDIRIEVDPAKVRKVERQNLIADARLANEELGWRPRMDFRDGLRRITDEELGKLTTVRA